MMELICRSLYDAASTTSKITVLKTQQNRSSLSIKIVTLFILKGLQQEGIYRSSGLKTRVVELRRAYNNRENVELKEVEPPVVASLLKQYLRYKNKFIYFDFTYFLNDFIFSTQGTSGQYFDQ